HVAHAKQSRPPAVVDGFHRAPGRPVSGAESNPRSRAVQQVRVDAFDPEMLKRAGKRLLNLGRNWCFRIIGQSMVLARLEGELRLQEQFAPGYQAALDG